MHDRRLHVVFDQALESLTPKERMVLQFRFGVGNLHSKKLREIGIQLHLTKKALRKLEMEALSKLDDSVRVESVSRFVKALFPEEQDRDHPRNVQVRELIESAKELNAHVISHLKRRPDDLAKLPWDTFEHLIAEFFASWGFQDVRLVGRDASTAADIFALRKEEHTGVELRYFVEVKRRREKADVQVIDRVYGAMVNERSAHGWHIGMIVSLAGVSKTQKFSRDEWRRLGMEFRARRNLLLHNGLVVNEAYQESSGLAEPPSKGTYLKIDQNYLHNSLATLLGVMMAAKESLSKKYKHYTKIKAAKALWAYLFKSPVMPFEDYWHVDEKADAVVASKTGKHESVISSSERLLLGLWRSHFNGDSDLLTGFNMRRFDRANQVKVFYFLTWATDFAFE